MKTEESKNFATWFERDFVNGDLRIGRVVSVLIVILSLIAVGPLFLLFGAGMLFASMLISSAFESSAMILLLQGISGLALLAVYVALVVGVRNLVRRCNGSSEKHSETAPESNPKQSSRRRWKRVFDSKRNWVFFSVPWIFYALPFVMGPRLEGLGAIGAIVVYVGVIPVVAAISFLPFVISYFAQPR